MPKPLTLKTIAGLSIQTSDDQWHQCLNRRELRVLVNGDRKSIGDLKNGDRIALTYDGDKVSQIRAFRDE